MIWSGGSERFTASRSRSHSHKRNHEAREAKNISEQGHEDPYFFLLSFIFVFLLAGCSVSWSSWFKLATPDGEPDGHCRAGHRDASDFLILPIEQVRPLHIQVERSRQVAADTSVKEHIVAGASRA